jgi:hypothetical protein
LKAGYHQLELDPESRHITTFCTHLGNFRYKRLNFGINSAAEIFQKKVEEVIEGIDTTANVSDDIIVGGEDQADHEKKVEMVLERLDKKELTVNEKKMRILKARN